MSETMNQQVSCYTVNDAWIYWYTKLTEQPRQPTVSRGGNVAAEFINTVTVIQDPTYNIVTSEVRGLSMRYAVGELLWYLSGSNKVTDISNFSSAWKRLSDDGETVNSAYGYRIKYKFGFDQWEHVKKLLVADPYSRQAVIHIKDASNEPTEDLPCTVCLQYFIRDGALHATTYMRSNDIWLGFPYDVFTFTCLQMKLAMELGISVGTYTHIAGSLHLYERNLQKEE